MSSLEIQKFRFYCDNCVNNKVRSGPNNNEIEILNHVDTNFAGGVYLNTKCKNCLKKYSELLDNNYRSLNISDGLRLIENAKWLKNYKFFSIDHDDEDFDGNFTVEIYEHSQTGDLDQFKMIDKETFLNSLSIGTILQYNCHNGTEIYKVNLDKRLSEISGILVKRYHYKRYRNGWHDIYQIVPIVLDVKCAKK